MFNHRNSIFLRAGLKKIKFFGVFTKIKPAFLKIPAESIVPTTSPRVFKSIGKKDSPDQIFETIDYSNEKQLNKMREQYEIELTFLNVFSKDLLKKFNHHLERIEKHTKKNNQISLNKETDSLLNLYYFEIKKSFASQNLENLSIFNKLLQENVGKLSFDLSYKEKFNKIITLYLEIFSVLNHYHYEEKNLLIQLITEFVKLLFSQLEIEIYGEIHNKKIGIIFEKSMDITFYREKIANHSTVDFFEEIGVLPNIFSKEFIPCLEEIKRKNEQIYAKNIDDFFHSLDVFLFKNKEKSAFFENKSLVSENELINFVNDCKNLHEINELLFLLSLDLAVKEKPYFKVIFNTNFSKNFPDFLRNSPIQTLLLFLLLSSRRDYPGPPPKLQQLLIFEKLMGKIQTLGQYLSVFSNIIDFFFSNCDKLLFYLSNLSKNHIYALSPLEILQLMRMTQTFDDISRELKVLQVIYKSIDEIFQKKYEQFSLQQKFLAFSFTHALDIPSKLKLNMEIIASIKECPKEMFPNILSHLCDYSYNLLDFKELETIAANNFKNYHLNTKIKVIQSFIYHLQGSNEFLSHALEIIIAELYFGNPEKFKQIPLGFLCNFYQIVFTIKHFYSAKLTALFDQNLNDWYDNFQKKYEEFDMPFYPIKLAFSKAEHEVQVLLDQMNIPYEKEKKLLLHKVDFLIKKRFCLEIHGRHHYANKVLFRGKDKWKERNLTKVGGYIYKVISVEQWNMSSKERQKALLEECLQEIGVISRYNIENIKKKFK